VTVDEFWELIDGDKFTQLIQNLGLSDWKFRVRVERIEAAITVADCDANPMYKIATVRYDAGYLADHDEATVLNTLRHELLHVFHAEATTLTQGNVSEFEFELAGESIVRRVERLLDHWGLSPEKLAEPATS